MVSVVVSPHFGREKGRSVQIIALRVRQTILISAAGHTDPINHQLRESESSLVGAFFLSPIRSYECRSELFFCFFVFGPGLVRSLVFWAHE